MQVIRLGFGPDYVDYQRAWDLQRELHAKVVAGEEPDTTLLLEHAAVYTAGKRTEAHERPLDGTPVIDVDRGGKITWHGPGQIVGYPIVRLPDPIDVVAHVRRLEDMMIRVCADFGVDATRVDGRSGTWVLADDGDLGDPTVRPDRKIGAIGIRVSQSVTMHGFALNCDVDLAWYDRFVPCGIADAGVTSLSRELGRDVTVAEVIPSVERHLGDHLAWTPYDATPDYEPRPDPARQPRIELLTPRA
jgi:lipoyl(octanoyl) transferase